MSRETIITNRFDRWKGTDQRTSQTLVPNDFFSFAKGIYFGLGDNAQRIFGKVLELKLESSIFGIHQIGGVTILQLRDTVVALDLPAAPSSSTGEEEDMSQAIIHHRLAANNVLASVATGSTWTLLPLNSVRSDPDTIVSLTSDQLTLAAGTYRVKATKNFYGTDRCKIRLFNVTDSSEIERGLTAFATVSGGIPSGGTCELFCRFTIGATKVVQFEYLTSSAISDGLTSYAPFPINTGGDEVDFVVEVLLEP